MSGRIHVVIDDRERDAYRARAAVEGVSLSEWLRQAARERLERAGPAAISTVAELDAFFEECGRREQGVEPDWAAHLAVARRSRSASTELT